MNTALVLDGELKSALAIVRSLGRRGVRVAAGSTRGSAMALASRYAAQAFVYRSPLNDPEGFIEDVIEMAKKLPQPPLVFASSDATMLLVSRNRDRLGEFVRLLLPSAESVEIAASKKDTAGLAAGLAPEMGIDMPPEYPASSLDDIEKLAVPYPAVVKPEHSAVWHGAGRADTAVVVSDKDELVREAGRILKTTGELPLIQKFLHGGEYGVEVLAKDGRVLAFAAHKRIRSLHPRGGASVVKETIDMPPPMRTATEAVIKKLLWTGVAMVEFKEDAATGKLYLLEINGRFWGSLPLAVYAGADFPYWYYELAEGREPGAQALRAGVSSRHFWGDVRWLASVWFARDPLRALLYPSRLAALARFLVPGHEPDVWSWSDPAPALAELRDIAARTL